MRAIARKKGGIGFLYGFITFIGVLLIPLGASLEHAGLFIAGIVLGTICGFLFAKSLFVPKEVISLNEDGMLVLHFCDTTLSPCEITDVSYHRASSRYGQYRFGKISLSTLSGTYNCDFVADVENVAKEITRLMYENKRA